MEWNTSCCFTGHRRLPEQQRSVIIERTQHAIRTLILERNVTLFYVGGALGFDTLVAELLFTLRETEFPQIEVVLLYPFDGFTEDWPLEEQEAYQRRLPLYDHVVRICPVPKSKSARRNAFLLRDRALIDNATYCVHYCTKHSGGTAYTLRYAAQQGTITLIDVADG